MLSIRADAPAARLYTKSRGILPIFPVTKECKVEGEKLTHCAVEEIHRARLGCGLTFYPGYYVQHPKETDAKRHFYPGIPKILPITTSRYVETALVEQWTLQLAIEQ